MNYFKGENFLIEVPDTTIRIGESYIIYLKIATDYGFIDEAKVIINQQKGTNEKEIRMNYITTEKNMNIFTCDIPLQNLGLYYFCLKLVINGNTTWIKNDIQNKCACITDENKAYWTITVYEKDFEVPDWAKGKIMYQIFPDRFYKSNNYVPIPIDERITKKWGDTPNWHVIKTEGADGNNTSEGNSDNYNNDFFMGNLKGIKEKLDYLKDLSVEIIYLNPIFFSQSNHRYDTTDYEMVDPYLGTNNDLKELCDEAHKKGIKIILDGVFNHTGNDSKYFNEFKKYNSVGAFQGEESPYYSWYKKNDNGNFTYWWGFKNLPVCDGNNTEWQNFVYGKGGIIDKWFELGIDGLRLDVADELTDDFIENIRNAVKRNKTDGFILGEVWENAITKEGYGKQRTYLLGNGLDSVMNYPFTNAILKYVRFGRFDYLIETIDDIMTEYPKEAVNSIMNSLSTHDITRAMTTLVGKGVQNSRYNLIWDVPFSREWQFSNDSLTDDEYEKAKQLFKIATVIQYFLPGNPCIYYGDEVGLYGYKDPFNRKCFPWDNIDNELHNFFVKLGKIHKTNSFLESAELKIVKADNDVFIFERFESEDELDNLNKHKHTKRMLIAVNRSENDVSVDLPEIYNNWNNVFEINSSDNLLKKYGIIIRTVK